MFEELIIWGPQVADEHDTLAELSEKDRAYLAKELEELDVKWGISLNKTSYVNSYQNDDYLFVAGLLQEVRDIHKKTYYDVSSSKWIRGHSEIPYIHLDFVERPTLKQDEFGNWISDDKQLNMGVKPPLPNGTYRLEFDYYWLKQYLKFLQTIFDSNEEIVVEFPDDVPQSTPQYKTRSEVLSIARHIERFGLREQADALRLYANSGINPEKMPEPCLTFLEEKGERKLITWCFFGEDGQSFTMPMKKSIYNTSGFAELFERRVELVSELFILSVKMKLAHETAHVARGHWNLREKEPEYSQTRNVMMNCEINADWTAAIWMINELLYDTVTDDPQYPVLAYKRKDLIYLWSVRILAVYLSQSWIERNEDRVWTEKTISDFVEKSSATHPIYQFRLFCTLNHIKEHLDHMAKQNKKDGYALRTADNTPLDEKLFTQVWERACDMIFSFEYAFRACWNTDERTSLEKLREGLYIVEKAAPKSEAEVPFFMCYMDDAKKELEDYERQWPEILAKLREYGMYFKM